MSGLPTLADLQRAVVLECGSSTADRIAKRALHCMWVRLANETMAEIWAEMSKLDDPDTTVEDAEIIHSNLAKLHKKHQTFVNKTGLDLKAKVLS